MKPITLSAAILVAIASNVLAESTIELESDPGDYIGQGKSYLYSDDNSQISYSRNYDNGIDVSIRNLPNDPDLRWTLNLAAPRQEEIQIGSYPLAERFPFQENDRPGLSFSGQGRGCNTLTGHFEVYEVSYDDSGNLSSLHAGFQQHCEGGPSSLKGIVSFNAVTPVGISVEGISPSKIMCKNKTTGQKVKAKVDGLIHDCRKLGLIVNPGDDVVIKVSGISD